MALAAGTASTRGAIVGLGAAVLVVGGLRHWRHTKGYELFSPGGAAPR